jgi:hypothetical protein
VRGPSSAAAAPKWVCLGCFSILALGQALNIHTKIVVSGFRQFPEYL